MLCSKKVIRRMCSTLHIIILLSLLLWKALHNNGPSYRKHQGECLQREYAEKKTGDAETG